jgi:hypothetical protein
MLPNETKLSHAAPATLPAKAELKAPIGVGSGGLLGGGHLGDKKKSSGYIRAFFSPHEPYAVGGELRIKDGMGKLFPVVAISGETALCDPSKVVINVEFNFVNDLSLNLELLNVVNTNLEKFIKRQTIKTGSESK